MSDIQPMPAGEFERAALEAASAGWQVAGLGGPQPVPVEVDSGGPSFGPDRSGAVAALAVVAVVALICAAVTVFCGRATVGFLILAGGPVAVATAALAAVSLRPGGR